MWRRHPAAAAAVLALGAAAWAPSAEAATCTVGADPDCPSLRAALRAAQERPGSDTVRLPAGELPSDGAAYTSEDRLDLVGAGARTSVVDGALAVRGSRVTVRDLAVRAEPEEIALEASGLVRTVRIIGAARDGVAIGASPGASLALHDVAIEATGLDAALDAPCAELQARHVTVAGTGDAGARAGCAQPAGEPGLVTLNSSIVAAGYSRSLVEGMRGEARAAYSNLAQPGDGTVTDPVPGDPGFESPSDLRLAPSSRLIEQGDSSPLAVDRPSPGEPDRSEPGEDLDGGVRVADGDGDGVARRDVGAYEVQARPFPVPTGNLLTDPDAEAGTSGPAPAWALSGGFESVAYGTSPFPSLGVAAVLGGGERFFSGGGSGDSSATQVVDVGADAAAIDTGAATATLSGLLGGYRADADAPSVRATFVGPSGVTLGMLDLAPVDAADRGNATNLLARTATGEVPALTRTVAVTLGAAKGPGGTYADAYFDNLGLTLQLPAPPDGGGGDGEPRRPEPTRPFAGISVLTGSTVVSRRTGRATLVVGCASATVARCTGDLTLEATLKRGAPRVRVGRAPVSLAPGGTRRLSVRIASAARAYLRTHTRLRLRVGTAGVDGQGVRKATTVPVQLRPQRRPKRR